MWEAKGISESSDAKQRAPARWSAAGKPQQNHKREGNRSRRLVHAAEAEHRRFHAPQPLPSPPHTPRKCTGTRRSAPKKDYGPFSTRLHVVSTPQCLPVTFATGQINFPVIQVQQPNSVLFGFPRNCPNSWCSEPRGTSRAARFSFLAAYAWRQDKKASPAELRSRDPSHIIPLRAGSTGQG